MKARADLNDLGCRNRAVVERVRKTMEEGAAQVAMRNRATLGMRANEIESAAKIGEKVVAKPVTGGLVPGIGFGDIAVREGGEADFPSHRGR